MTGDLIPIPETGPAKKDFPVRLVTPGEANEMLKDPVWVTWNLRDRNYSLWCEVCDQRSAISDEAVRAGYRATHICKQGFEVVKVSGMKVGVREIVLRSF